MYCSGITKREFMKGNIPMETEKLPLKIGVLVYTYNRTDDARINMELIRREWSKIQLLQDVPIMHCFNGEHAWWPEKYLEDELCRTENPGHFSGAVLLLDKGMEIFSEKHPDVTHVVILASDTWCVEPQYIARVVTSMRSDEKYLATSAWGSKKDPNMFRIRMSLDFSIVDLSFARATNLFPLRYQEFVEKYGELLSYQGGIAYPERVFALRFKQAIQRFAHVPSENLIEKIAAAHIHHMTEREPIHRDKKVGGKLKGIREMYWPKIGLITHHDPTEKQKALASWPIDLGEYGQKFLEATDLTYFNNGLVKTVFEKGGTKIGYND
jgi:hypothetical protein